MNEFNIVEVTRNTANHMREVLLQLAQHIEKLEFENAELKRKLGAHNDDLK
jgi:hypothetical protein